jgi:paired small multidrug resistance pump
VYATFTGSGAAAIAIIDFSFLGETFTLAKGFFILLIIIGVVGIQLTTGEKKNPEDKAGSVKEGGV